MTLLRFAPASELVGWRHPIEESAQPSPVDREHEPNEALLQRGVLERACVHRLVARISDELLDDLPRLLVTAPQVARRRARFAEAIVERCEVGVERLRRRTVRPRLHEFRVRREAPRRLCAHEVRRVDHRFTSDAMHFVEVLGDRAAGDRYEHSLCLGDVTALSSDPRYLVARSLPEIREPTADVAFADHSDLHRAPSSSGWLARMADHTLDAGEREAVEAREGAMG